MFSDEEDYRPLADVLISQPALANVNTCFCCFSETCLNELKPLMPTTAKSTSFLSQAGLDSPEEREYIKLEPMELHEEPVQFPQIYAEDLMSPGRESDETVNLFDATKIMKNEPGNVVMEGVGEAIKEVKVLSCFKRIENPTVFVKRENWENRPKYARYREKKYVCDVCDRSFTLKQNIAQHFYQYHHPRIPSKNRELKEVVARYCCTKCDKIFTDLGKAQRHEKRMHRDPATKVLPTCNQCNKTFTSPHLLVEHISVVHEHLKPFKCDKCDQTFGRSGGLRRHVLMVHENKMFMCPYDDCDHPGYKCSKALTAHIRSKHTHERPYECMYCEKSFVRKNDLRVHEMTHSSEPHFKCGVCGTGFRRESYLRRHRMHCGLVKEEVKPKKKALRLKPPKKAKKSKKKKN